MTPEITNEIEKLTAFVEPEPEDGFPGAKIFADSYHYGRVVQKSYL